MSPLRRAFIVVVACLLSAVACSRGQERTQRQAPIPVTVARAEEQRVPLQLRAIGTVQPTVSVTVRSHVTAMIERIHFKEGQDVERGQALFSMDRRPLEAALRQAQANLAKAVTERDNARRDAERYAELARRGFVAQQQYEQMRTNAASLDETVRAAQAAVENARVQLGYATIRAPISGRTGVVAIREGDLVKADDTALVVVNQLRPIDIAFALPERDLAEVQRYEAQGALDVAALAPAAQQPVAHGRLSFIDNRVDSTTGTIQLKATFANDPLVLWPGQFMTVVLTLTTEPAVVVPSHAVQAGQDGRYVFVVKSNSTVESRPVTVGRAVGGETVIAKGVAPGETVVTEGQLRLFPGAHVEARTGTAGNQPAQGEGAASPRTAPR